MEYNQSYQLYKKYNAKSFIAICVWLPNAYAWGFEWYFPMEMKLLLGERDTRIVNVFVKDGDSQKSWTVGNFNENIYVNNYTADL